MGNVLLQQITDGVLTISFNRPEARNAWNHELEEGLRNALQDADANGQVRVIVLTGAGRTFCPGPDPNALASGGSWRPAPLSDEDFEQRYSYILGLRKPVIAAVNGAAAGVGLCVALYCDLRFISANARITTAFARRGLVAEHGSAWMLPRLVGWMNATDLLMSGRVVTAEEADRMGLARALPAEGFLDAVQAYAGDLAQSCSPRSMMIIKRQIREGWMQSLTEATALAARETELALQTADFAEGVAHFVEKRTPQFPGV